MRNANEKYTILYARLSQEDDREGESNSIHNQKIILETYAKNNGFRNLKFMGDDGFSGTNFDRPAWNEVVKLIESDMVATIMVKDMSRLGRDYLQTGQLLEIIFPSYDIRFIAVNDNIDSLKGLDDFIPFRNIIHDLYAKDTSKKVRTVKKSMAERGERIGGKAPYGYKKDPDNKLKIIPDEDAALIVKKIFRLCADGKGPRAIAKLLKQEKILNPTNDYFRKTGIAHLNLNTEEPYKWSNKTVGTILKDEVYLGHTIGLKSKVLSYKNPKKVEKSREEWVKVENTHEPIVDEMLWEVVQRVREQKRRPTVDATEPHIFSGMLFCSDCHKPLNVQRYNVVGGKNISFRCSTNRLDSEECTPHTIKESQINAIVLDDLKRVTHLARQNEERFAQYIGEKSTKETQQEITNNKKEIEKLKYRNAEISRLFKKLYEDNISGRLPNSTFDFLSNEYQTEQMDIADKLPRLSERGNALASEVGKVAGFIEKAKQYTEITELTSEIVRLFIDKIVVGGKAKKYDYSGEQKVDIYYRDIGLLND